MYNYHIWRIIVRMACISADISILEFSYCPISASSLAPENEYQSRWTVSEMWLALASMNAICDRSFLYLRQWMLPFSTFGTRNMDPRSVWTKTQEKRTKMISTHICWSNTKEQTLPKITCKGSFNDHFGVSFAHKAAVQCRTEIRNILLPKALI